jgi:hypothetical protein
MRQTLLAILIVFAASGCASTVPGAEKVVITSDPQDIIKCKVVGQERNVTNAKDAKKTAFIDGADTILITRTFAWTKMGVPYNCSGVDPRQPVPVTKPQ